MHFVRFCAWRNTAICTRCWLHCSCSNVLHDHKEGGDQYDNRHRVCFAAGRHRLVSGRVAQLNSVVLLRCFCFSRAPSYMHSECVVSFLLISPPLISPLPSSFSQLPTHLKSLHCDRGRDAQRNISYSARSCTRRISSNGSRGSTTRSHSSLAL